MERVKLKTETTRDDRLPYYKAAAYLRYKEMIYIDPMRIGEELVELPTLVMDVGEIVAVAISRRDMATNFLKEQTSRAAEQIREAHPGKPPSEAKVTSEVQKHKWVLEATESLENAKHDLSLWQAVMDAAKTKASSLKATSELIISGYLTPNSINVQRRSEIAYLRKQRKGDANG